MEHDETTVPTLSVGLGGAAPSTGSDIATSYTGSGGDAEVKIHSILCNRASAWASRIYDNIGSEASSMQRAEGAMRQALSGMPSEGTSGESKEVEEEATPEAAPEEVVSEEPEEVERREAASPDTAVSVSIAPVDSEEEKLLISWKCGCCGYHVLAMDQDGRPLPLSRGAYGELLPIRCPQCEMEHTSWEQAIPFDKHGDHVNIRSTLSNNYVTQCRKRGEVAASSRQPNPPSSRLSTNTPSLARRELPPILANIGRVTYKDGVAVPNNHAKPRQTAAVRMAFYCSLCGRRLLRVDSEGELVAMDVDGKGEVLPIRCPGCGEVHNRWEVRPFTVGRMTVRPAIKRDHDAGNCVEPLPSW